jgi:hypothetical protein
MAVLFACPLSLIAQIAPDVPKPPESLRQRLDEPQLAVDLSPDGRRIVCSGQNHSVRQWSLDGQELPALQKAPGGWSVAFSPDGKWIVGCGLDRTVRLWDSETGRELRQLEGHAQIAWMAQFLPDGQRIVSVGEDSTIRFWNANDGKEIGQFLGHPGPIWCMALSPDGRWLATGGSDGVMRLWDMASGKPRQLLQGSHGGGVGTLAFSPDGRTIASTGWQDQKIFLWEVATGRCRRQIPHAGGSKSVAFSPDGGTFITAGNDKAIRFWDLSGERELPALEGHKGTVNGVALSHDGRTLVSVGSDNTVRAWSLDGRVVSHKSAPWPQRQLEASWAALARPDAKGAFDAVCALAASPEQTLDLFRQRLRPASSSNVQRISALIADTNNGQYAIRQAASFELEKMGEEAESQLRRAVRESASLESKRRAERALKKLERGGLSAETLRSLRAVEVLERIANPEARQMLTALAGGAPDTRLTVEAQAALKRIAK